MIRRLACLAICLALAACAALVETDQARLCRMALPALAPPDAVVTILKQREFPDGRGLRVDYRLNLFGAPAQTRFAECRFKSPGRPKRSEDLVALTTDDGPLWDVRLAILVRYWLTTPDARAADPAPLGDAAAACPAAFPRLCAAAGDQRLAPGRGLCACSRPPIRWSTDWSGASISRSASSPRRAATRRRSAPCSWTQPPRPILAVAFVFGRFVAAFWGFASSRWVFQPLHRATGQKALVATIGLALFAAGIPAPDAGRRLELGQPDAQRAVRRRARRRFHCHDGAQRAGSPAALALLAGVALIALMQRHRSAARWRASADDRSAPSCSASIPRAIFGATFALASGFAGLPAT